MQRCLRDISIPRLAFSRLRFDNAGAPFALAQTVCRLCLLYSLSIVAYFGNVPTVSHRSHNVGINTNSMTDEDVLVIENYQNRKYVKLVGIGGKLNTITIDLSTGEVSVMTLSGGEW